MPAPRGTQHHPLARSGCYGKKPPAEALLGWNLDPDWCDADVQRHARNDDIDATRCYCSFMNPHMLYVYQDVWEVQTEFLARLPLHPKQKVLKVGTRQERGRPWRQVPTITIIMMSHGLRTTVVANCREQMPAAKWCAGMFPTPKSRQGKTFFVQQSVFFLRVWFWSWYSLAILVCMFHVMRAF